MSFWNNFLIAAGMTGGFFFWLVLGFVVVALALFVYLPQERGRLRNAMLLFALSLAGLLSAATLLSLGMPAQSTASRR